MALQEAHVSRTPEARKLWGEARALMSSESGYVMGASPHFYGALVHSACIAYAGSGESHQLRILEVAATIGGVAGAVKGGEETVDRTLALMYGQGGLSRMLFGELTPINS